MYIKILNYCINKTKEDMALTQFRKKMKWFVNISGNANFLILYKKYKIQLSQNCNIHIKNIMREWRSIANTRAMETKT